MVKIPHRKIPEHQKLALKEIRLREVIESHRATINKMNNDIAKKESSIVSLNDKCQLLQKEFDSLEEYLKNTEGSLIQKNNKVGE